MAHIVKKPSPNTLNPKYLSFVMPKEWEPRGHKLQKTAPCLKKEESRLQLCIYVHITPQDLHLQTFWIYSGFNAWSFWKMIHWCVIFAALMISTQYCHVWLVYFCWVTTTGMFQLFFVALEYPKSRNCVEIQSNSDCRHVVWSPSLDYNDNWNCWLLTFTIRRGKHHTASRY